MLELYVFVRCFSILIFSPRLAHVSLDNLVFILNPFQEVDVLNLDMSSDMGSALVDVKGFRLLKKCANAQRQRRTGH